MRRRLVCLLISILSTTTALSAPAEKKPFLQFSLNFDASSLRSEVDWKLPVLIDKKKSPTGTYQASITGHADPSAKITLDKTQNIPVNKDTGEFTIIVPVTTMIRTFIIDIVESPEYAAEYNLDVEIITGRKNSAFADIRQDLLSNLLLSSYVQAEGLSYLSFSTTQTTEEIPFSMGLGAKGLYWFKQNRHGAEARVNGKIVSINSAGSLVNPINIEADYHYRWVFSSTKGFIHAKQLTAFAGAQFFTNLKSNQQYLPNAFLPKIGVSLQLGLFSRYATGGRATVGFNGAITQYELEGDGTYFFDKKKAAGLGYNVVLDQANTAKGSADGVLPYREAHAKLFGFLRFILD